MAANHTHLDGLIEALKRHSVLGLCGAGLSVPLGYPTWLGLIRLLIDHHDTTNAIPLHPSARLAVNGGNPHLPTCAEYLQRQMSPSQYHDFITSVFAPQGTVDFSAEHDLLVRLPIRLWMTTNYDTCLAEALRERLGRNISIAADIPVSDLLGDSTTLPFVVHLHGAVADPKGIVLGASDFDDKYLLSQRLRQSFAGLAPFNIFFVGYGFGDDELNQSLHTTAALLGTAAGKHFALLPRDPREPAAAIQFRTNDLERRGVRPIFYSATDDDHSDRMTVLKGIARHVAIGEMPQRHEFELKWNGSVGHTHLRTALHGLTSDTGINIHLRECSFQKRCATVAVESAADITRLKAQSEKSIFGRRDDRELGQQISPERPLAIPPVFRRDGRLFRPTGKTQQEAEVITREVLETASFDETADLEAAFAGRGMTSYVTSSPSADYRVTMHALAHGILDANASEIRHIHQPLMPTPLRFGLADCFHPSLDWRLESPVIHVWVYISNDSTEQASERVVSVTALGTGLPHIRRRLEAATYSIAMSLSETSSDVVITPNVIHVAPAVDVSNELGKKTGTGLVRKLLGALISSGDTAKAPVVSDETVEAMESLRAICAELAQETGLVQLHVAPYDDLRTFYRTLFPMIHGSGNLKPMLRRPTPARRAVLCLPVPLLRPSQPRIGLRISGDLLKASELEELLDALYREVTVRLLADLERRIEFWNAELERDLEGVRWFKSLSAEEQEKEPDVSTGCQILADLAIDVETPQKHIPAKVYFLDHLPKYHIPRQKAELERFARLRKPVATLLEDRHSFLWERCLARVLDCAIRRLRLSEDEKTNALFDRWARQAEPMLQLEWERVLAANHLRREDVFKRITFFDARYDAASNTILVQPLVVLDSARAVIAVDPSVNTLRVDDPSDGATNEISDRPAPWGRVTELITDDEHETARTLVKAAYANHELASSICDAALTMPASQLSIDDLRPRARRVMESETSGQRFFRWCGHAAFLSAFECLSPEDHGEAPPSKWIAVAFANCLRLRREVFSTFREVLKSPTASVPQAIRTPLLRAYEQDRDLVERFIREKWLGSSKPVDDVAVTPAERAALRLEQFSELVQLRSVFREAAESLDSTGETTASTFAKAEAAFEAAHAAIFAQQMPSVQRIQRILTGQPFDGEA